MLNLWIGLCKGVPGLPPVFREMGYVEHTIEQEFYVGLPNRKCCPEIILCSEKMRHTLLCEWKDGQNTKAEQLETYAAVSTQYLSQGAFVRTAATESFDVAIFGRLEYVERLKIGLNDKFPFPLLAVDNGGIALVHNQFKCSHLNRLFSKRIDFDFNSAPVSFVPVDADSPDIDVAKHVIPKVLDALSYRPARIACNDLCIAMCRLWSTFGKKAKDGMMNRVEDVIKQAAAGEFQGYFRWMGGATGYLDILENPLEYSSDRRSAAYKKLNKLHIQFIERLQSGRRFDIQSEMY